MSRNIFLFTKYIILMINPLIYVYGGNINTNNGGNNVHIGNNFNSSVSVIKDENDLNKNIHFNIDKNHMDDFKTVLVAIPKNMTNDLMANGEMKYDYFKSQKVNFILKMAQN